MHANIILSGLLQLAPIVCCCVCLLRVCACSVCVCCVNQQVHQTVTAGGKVLVPVFAVGRAQELLMLLEEHWQRTELQVRCIIQVLGYLRPPRHAQRASEPTSNM